jgi:hypothetical protein
MRPAGSHRLERIEAQSAVGGLHWEERKGDYEENSIAQKIIFFY